MNLNVSTIVGYIPISSQLLEVPRSSVIQSGIDMEYQADGSWRLVERNPWHGPELPNPWAMWQELGGRPAGPYRRAA